MTKKPSGEKPRKKGSRLTTIYNSSAIQAALAALPPSLGATGDPKLVIAGGAFSVVTAALTAHLASQVEQNQQELSDRFDERVRKLEQKDHLREQVLGQREFHALVFQAAVASAQESDETTSKIDWYAAILAGAASSERPPDLNLRALLSSITFLTADEMRLARRFYEEGNTGGHSVIDGLAQPLWGPDTGLYLRRLETANLISPRAIAGFGPGGPTRSYFVTDTFHRLMALVRETE